MWIVASRKSAGPCSLPLVEGQGEDLRICIELRPVNPQLRGVPLPQREGLNVQDLLDKGPGESTNLLTTSYIR